MLAGTFVFRLRRATGVGSGNRVGVPAGRHAGGDWDKVPYVHPHWGHTVTPGAITAPQPKHGASSWLLCSTTASFPLLRISSARPSPRSSLMPRPSSRMEAANIKAEKIPHAIKNASVTESPLRRSSRQKKKAAYVDPAARPSNTKPVTVVITAVAKEHSGRHDAPQEVHCLCAGMLIPGRPLAAFAVFELPQIGQGLDFGDPCLSRFNRNKAPTRPPSTKMPTMKSSARFALSSPDSWEDWAEAVMARLSVATNAMALMIRVFIALVSLYASLMSVTVLLN